MKKYTLQNFILLHRQSQTSSMRGKSALGSASTPIKPLCQCRWTESVERGSGNSALPPTTHPTMQPPLHPLAHPMVHQGTPCYIKALYIIHHYKPFLEQTLASQRCVASSQHPVIASGLHHSAADKSSPPCSRPKDRFPTG